MATSTKGWSDEKLYARYPAVKNLVGPDSGEAWGAAFDLRPDVVHAMLADVIKLSYASPGRVGQRPMPKEEDVKDLDVLVRGEVNMRPIHKVLPELMGDMSERKFAVAIDMSRRMLQRLLSGEYQPTVEQMRSIAEVVGVPPAHFVEYRRVMVSAAVLGFFSKEPGVTDRLYGYVVNQARKRQNGASSVKDVRGVHNVVDAVKTIHGLAERFDLKVKVSPGV